ncbi:MAG: hypothetical protein ACWA6Y_07900 [Polaromonas sp.]
MYLLGLIKPKRLTHTLHNAGCAGRADVPGVEKRLFTAFLQANARALRADRAVRIMQFA